MRGKLFTGSGRPPVLESCVEMGKTRRIIKTIHLLTHGRYNTKQLAAELQCSPRTAARLLNLLEMTGIDVECSMRWEYFIASDNCPLCGRQPTTTALENGHAEKHQLSA